VGQGGLLTQVKKYSVYLHIPVHLHSSKQCEYDQNVVSSFHFALQYILPCPGDVLYVVAVGIWNRRSWVRIPARV
jgi:hypothetical protein